MSLGMLRPPKTPEISLQSRQSPSHDEGAFARVDWARP